MINVPGGGIGAGGNKYGNDLPLVIGDKTGHQYTRIENIHQDHFPEKGAVLSEELLDRFLGQPVPRYFQQVTILRLVEESKHPGAHNDPDDEEEEHNGCEGQHVKRKLDVWIGIRILHQLIHHRCQVPADQVDYPTEEKDNQGKRSQRNNTPDEGGPEEIP